MGKLYGDSSECGGGGALEGVANFSALPDPTANAGVSYFVEASEGTPWLPGSLGGSYYPRGVYYSNGTEWLYQENPGQATQAEVNAGLIDDKFVSPKTLAGAGIISDKNFTFIQATASASWLVTHNLGKIPSITVVDTAGNLVEGAVVLATGNENNELTINFNAPFSGTASLN